MGMFHNKNSVFVFVCPQTRLQSGLVFSDWTLYSSVTFDLADCDSVYVWSQNHTLLFELSKFVLDSSQGLLFSFSNITWMARHDHQRRISRKWIPKLGSFRDEGREENDWRLPRWSVDSIVLCWHFLRTTLGDKQSQPLERDPEERIFKRDKLQWEQNGEVKLQWTLWSYWDFIDKVPFWIQDTIQVF